MKSLCYFRAVIQKAQTCYGFPQLVKKKKAVSKHLQWSIQKCYRTFAFLVLFWIKQQDISGLIIKQSLFLCTLDFLS